MGAKIWASRAVDLAHAIRIGELSSREVVQAHLDRIDDINGQVNAVTVTLAADALAAADAADRAVGMGEPLGPLHGVPFTVKESIDLVGSATTRGVRALTNAIPPRTSPSVTQLQQAGAIPIGRTNLPDFALRWHTDSSLYGPTLNPWGPRYTPGGSSGGEAVAIATGMTPFGIGSDYGGSLRWPAQCCGVTAIRPTLGRVPAFDSLAPRDSLLTGQLFSVQGPMARRVADVRLVLACMSERDLLDPWHTPAPLETQPLERRRVAVTSGAGGSIDQVVAEGVQHAARVLVQEGYIVEDVDPPLVEEGAMLWAHLVATEIHFLLPQLEVVLGTDAQQFLHDFLAVFPAYTLEQYMLGLAERNRIAREWSLFHGQYPLVLAPVATAQPFNVGRDLVGREAVADIFHSLRYLLLMNLLGKPSVATPIGVVSGLPQAVQVIGPRYQESWCLDAAELIEKHVQIGTPIDPRRGGSSSSA